MNLLDELTNGYFTKKQYVAQSKSDTYNVYVAFDNDEPLILFKDIDKLHTTTLKFDMNNKFFEITCPVSGKLFKIYVKDSNENPKFNPTDYPNYNDIENDDEEDDED